MRFPGVYVSAQPASATNGANTGQTTKTASELCGPSFLRLRSIDINDVEVQVNREA